jgi:transcription initiation factor TFIID subunit 1
VETVYPRKKENHRGFLDSVVGDARRQVENKRVEEVVSSGNVETDLRKALEVRLIQIVPWIILHHLIGA